MILWKEKSQAYKGGNKSSIFYLEEKLCILEHAENKNWSDIKV